MFFSAFNFKLFKFLIHIWGKRNIEILKHNLVSSYDYICEYMRELMGCEISAVNM